MVIDVRPNIRQLKEDLMAVERKLSRFSRSPSKLGSNISSTVDNRPPWNHGGGCSRSNSVAHDDDSRRTPVRTRSRTRNPSPAPRALHPIKTGGSTSKNIVHKQTIKANDKTVVEVSVKTKQQGKRPLTAVNPVLTKIGDQLVHPFSNAGISPCGAKKYDLPWNPGVVPPVKKETSWSNILGQSNSHATVPDGLSTKRCCENSPKTFPKRGPAAVSSQEFAFQEPNGGQPPSRIREGGDCDGTNPDSYRKLNNLVKELWGVSRDPTIQKIAADFEETLANFQSKENLEPPAAALRSRRRSRKAPTSPLKVTPSQEWDFHEIHRERNLLDSDLLRLSPAPERRLPETNIIDGNSGAPLIIDRFLKTVSAATQSSASTEKKTHVKKSRHKDEVAAMYKEDLVQLCQKLEESCLLMEADCQKMRNERAELKKNLIDKEADLASANATLEGRIAEISELRTNLNRAEDEVRKLREELSKTVATSEDIKNLQVLQKRTHELLDENHQLTIELSLVRMEKEKLSTMLTNKDNELDKFKLAVRDIQAMIAEQLANIHSLSDHNRTLVQLDAMMRSLSKQSLLSDVTIEEKNFDEKVVRPENLNPVHSSPNSSACTSEVFLSWQRLSTITSEEELPKRRGRAKETKSQRQKKKTADEAKRTSGVGDIFSELKNKSSASATVSLPSPPREIGLSISGISHWTEESTYGSMTLSDESESDTDSTI